MSYELACKFLYEGISAVKVLDVDSGEEIFFPLSQVESMHKDTNGNGSIVVTDWIAEKKGLT